MEFAGSGKLAGKTGMLGERCLGRGLSGRFAEADASARRPYLGRLGLIWLIARKQSAGTHLSAMTQNSLQGGRPVYSTRFSKL
jgi:hypothetical protein